MPSAFLWLMLVPSSLRLPAPVNQGVRPLMSQLWQHVRELFEGDDGSLPDIFVENLSEIEIITVYEWVMSRCSVFGNPMAWSITDKKDIAIKDIHRPAQAFVEGEIEMFRHGLADLSYDGRKLPELTICVELEGISFDYRKGAAWNAHTVQALFSMLADIKQIAPSATITQAEEGCTNEPSQAFSAALQSFTRANSLVQRNE